MAADRERGRRRARAAAPAAVQAMSFPVVKLLIEHGADPNSVRLDAAVASSADDITLYLLDHGAKPDEVLWNAVYFGKRAIAQKALEKGASISETELITATDNRDVRMVRLLLAHCGYTKIDESPIDYARKIGAKKILNMLLKARNGPCAQSWQ